jgi:tetratricopeptide (TPR) repeat protein
MSFFTQQGRTLLLAVVMVVGACCLVGCGGGGGQGDAAAELEKEATRWAKGGGGVTYEEEGVFFTFNGYAGEGMVFWTATGKKAIGDCPAGSEWVLRIDPEDGTKSSNFPPKCKSITPKAIIDFASGGSGGGNAVDFVKRGTEYLDRGDKNNNKADYDLAITEFDRALQLDPNSAAAYFGRGRGYLRKGDNSKAIADYSQALRLNPNDAISYSNRGRAYARMGDYDNAAADFESALRIDPSNAAIKQNLEKAKRREKGL